MKLRAGFALGAWLLVGAALGLAQETPKPEHTTPAAAESSESEPSPIWAWINFALLAAALGYLAQKKGGPYFAARSQSIRHGIAEAQEIRANAEARAAEVDRKLAGLGAEMESMRANVRREQAAEAERIRAQTAADLARIQQHSAGEIDSAGKAAHLELKRYAARLAVDLAAEKIRRQMTPQVQAALVENFGRDLEHGSDGPHPIQ